jgi:hypothetical protein
MALRAFGKLAVQGAIWNAAKQVGPLGVDYIPTIRLAEYLTSRGLNATVIQLKNARLQLQTLAQADLVAILAQRKTFDSNEGHFTVLVSATAEHVKIHDPLIGPNVTYTLDEMTSLLTPADGVNEILPNIVLVLTKGSPPTRDPCVNCGAAIPTTVACACCDDPMIIAHHVAVGCLDANCAGRLATAMICSRCGMHQ